MGFFSRRKPDLARPAVVFIHLNARLQPIHRGSVYEDPLDQMLAEHAPGSEIVGGGTEFTPETGPLSCDIEVQISGDQEQTVQFVIEALERLGAPVGSWAQMDNGPQLSFGATHGLALSLDGSSLPAETYETNDINELISALTSELGEEAEMQSWWEGAERTSLYFYARDVARLRSVLESAADRFPLAQRSLVEPIT